LLRLLAMHPQRPPPPLSTVEVLDRVLDKGIVIAAGVRVSLVGIDLVQLEARVVVASIETYLRHSPVLGRIERVATPTGAHGSGPVRLSNVRSRRQFTRHPSRESALRRSAARLFRCSSGCAFRLDTAGSVLTSVQIACPYQARTTCSIRPIPTA